MEDKPPIQFDLLITLSDYWKCIGIDDNTRNLFKAFPSWHAWLDFDNAMHVMQITSVQCKSNIKLSLA